MTKGRLIYASVPVCKMLQEFGTEFISPDFAKRKYIKYNSAILLLLKLAGMREQMKKIKFKPSKEI